MSALPLASARIAIVALLLVIAGGCAKRVREVPVSVTVETYLSTARHNDVTRDHAIRRCLGLGRNAVWRETTPMGPRGYAHKYECV